MNCWLQEHKSGITWKHAEDTTEIHRTLLPALHIHNRPRANRPTKAGHHESWTRGPQGVHRPKMGPNRLNRGLAEPMGRPNPNWGGSGPTFAGALIYPLIHSMAVPTASILENGWNRPISAIKGASLTPSQHTPPRSNTTIPRCSRVVLVGVGT